MWWSIGLIKYHIKHLKLLIKQQNFECDCTFISAAEVSFTLEMLGTCPHHIFKAEFVACTKIC